MALRDSNYIVIPAIARNEYNLSGNELLIFGIIYGFSQADRTAYTGTIQYIQNWTGLGERTILRILKKLTDEGILKKKKIASNECHYSVNLNFTDCQNGNQLTAKMADSERQIGNQSTAKMADNNIYINNNIKENIKRKKFKKPSIQELKNYCQEINSKIDVQVFYDYYETNGWIAGKVPMKDWKAAIRNWTRNNYKSNSNINKHDYQKEITQKELDLYDRK